MFGNEFLYIPIYIKTVVYFPFKYYRFELPILSKYCSLVMKSKFEKTDTNDLHNGDNNHRDNEENKMDLDNIVSSFWQENYSENNLDDGDEMNASENNDNKVAFSDDEIVELREIFQSQAINNNKSTVPIAGNDFKTNFLDDAPDEFFFVPDINKTINRSKCSDLDDLPNDGINRGILGESPSKDSHNLSKPISSVKVNAGDKAENSSLELIKFSSNSTAKSSLEVLLSNSPKPELEETANIEIRSGSYASGNSYGSAYADTEPCSETEIKAALSNNPNAFTPKGRKIISDNDSIELEHIHSKNIDDGADINNVSSTQSPPGDFDSTVKTPSRKLQKRKKNSGPLSVITIPSEKEQVLVLDKSNQAKTKCEELTVVGSMFFTNDDDYHKFVEKNSPSNATNSETVEEGSSLVNKSHSELLVEERTIVINRDTTTTTSSETEADENKKSHSHDNFSSMNLFHDSVRCFMLHS